MRSGAIPTCTPMVKLPEAIQATTVRSVDNTPSISYLLKLLGTLKSAYAKVARFWFKTGFLSVVMEVMVYFFFTLMSIFSTFISVAILFELIVMAAPLSSKIYNLCY